jgi:hypothetical protein
MPQFHTDAPQQHITAEKWQLHDSYNAILNDLEDALTGQRLLDLHIVQTYADIVEQSEAHIRAVQTRIQAVEKERLRQEAEEEAAKREAEEEAERQRQEEEKRQQAEEQRQFEEAAEEEQQALMQKEEEEFKENERKRESWTTSHPLRLLT